MTNTQRTDEQKTNSKPCKVGHCDGMCYCTEDKIAPLTNDESVVEEFNRFIENWCGDNFPHLIDSDENDGEEFRDRLRALTTQHKAEVEKAVREALHAVDVLCESSAEYPNGMADGAWVYLGKIKSIIRSLTNKRGD